MLLGVTDCQQIWLAAVVAAGAAVLVGEKLRRSTRSAHGWKFRWLIIALGSGSVFAAVLMVGWDLVSPLGNNGDFWADRPLMANVLTGLVTTGATFVAVQQLLDHLGAAPWQKSAQHTVAASLDVLRRATPAIQKELDKAPIDSDEVHGLAVALHEGVQALAASTIVLLHQTDQTELAEEFTRTLGDLAWFRERARTSRGHESGLQKRWNRVLEAARKVDAAYTQAYSSPSRL